MALIPGSRCARHLRYVCCSFELDAVGRCDIIVGESSSEIACRFKQTSQCCCMLQLSVMWLDLDANNTASNIELSNYG